MGGVALIPWQYFLNCLTLFMILFLFNLIILVSPSYFPLLSQFHYPSLLNDIQIWDIHIWITNEDKYKFWIYLFSNHGWISSNDLFNPNHKWNPSMKKWHSSIWSHSSMNIFIHVGGLNFKFQLSSKLQTYVLRSCTSHFLFKRNVI
jgi:hypothetical protein